MTDLTQILHVEDDPDIADVVRISLTVLGGLEVHQFASGTDAVASAPTLAADLLLLDMMMPGLDGLATLEKLRQMPQFAATPAVLFTAKTIDLPVGEDAAMRGIIATIRKPFGAAELPGQIRKLWDAHYLANQSQDLPSERSVA